LDTEGWSPDGRWLPYWVAGMDVYYQRDEWPSALYFLDAERRITCQQPGVTSTTWGDGVFWEPDSSVAVVLAGRVQVGRPCEPLSPDPESTYALPVPSPGITPDWAIPPAPEPSDRPGPEDTERSPSGELSVTTVAEVPQESYTTRLTRISDGKVTTEVKWRGNGGFGDAGTGGEWTADDQFLINYTTDQGPLLIQPDGVVLNVAKDIFGLEVDAPTPEVQFLDALDAFLTPDRRHLRLQQPGKRVMLYHPESGVSETLPTTELWRPMGSPDGSWLFVNGLHSGETEDPGAWMRPIDGSNAEFRRLPAGKAESWELGYVPSPSGNLLAVVDSDSHGLEVVSFPDLKSVGRWRWTDADQAFVTWSPTESHLSVDGILYAGPGKLAARSLYLVPLPTSAPTPQSP
jgi:hypothetical protein